THRTPPSFPTRRSSDLNAVDHRIRNGISDTHPAAAGGRAGMLPKTAGGRRVCISGVVELDLVDERALQLRAPDAVARREDAGRRSEEHTSELQSRGHLV